MSDASRPSLAAASLRPNPRGGRAGFRLWLQPVMNGCFQADASRGQVSFSLASFAVRTVFLFRIGHLFRTLLASLRTCICFLARAVLLCAATWNPSGKLQQCNRRCIQLVVRLKTRVFPDKSVTASFLIMGVNMMRHGRMHSRRQSCLAGPRVVCQHVLCCEIRFFPAVMYAAA